MKKISIVFLVLLLNSCGVSKEEYAQALNENELLKNEIAIKARA